MISVSQVGKKPQTTRTKEHYLNEILNYLIQLMTQYICEKETGFGKY